MCILTKCGKLVEERKNEEQEHSGDPSPWNQGGGWTFVLLVEVYTIRHTIWHTIQHTIQHTIPHMIWHTSTTLHAIRHTISHTIGHFLEVSGQNKLFFCIRPKKNMRRSYQLSYQKPYKNPGIYLCAKLSTTSMDPVLRVRVMYGVSRTGGWGANGRVGGSLRFVFCFKVYCSGPSNQILRKSAHFSAF